MRNFINIYEGDDTYFSPETRHRLWLRANSLRLVREENEFLNKLVLINSFVCDIAIKTNSITYDRKAIINLLSDIGINVPFKYYIC